MKLNLKYREAGECTSIHIWFHDGFWLIQKFDENDRELFDEEDEIRGLAQAEYYTSKKLATNEIPSLLNKFPKAVIKVFKRDGEVQKELKN